jgi:very-short-patch-repair endonuclease
LSHRSAADLHELRRTDRARIDITVPGRTQVIVEGVDAHCSRTLTAGDITLVDGIRCTSIARTFVDLARVVPRRAVERALDQAEVLEVLDLRKLIDALERNRHSRGAGALKAILADYQADAPTESDLEELLFALLRAGDLPLPERQVYIDPGDGEPAVRADFVWREQRLIVETDGGRVHGTRRAFEADRRRDQRLLLAGWRVIRITWRQIKQEPLRIQRLIGRALRQS